MSEGDPKNEEMITFESTRFGTLNVTASSVITFPSGLIGFPQQHRFVMLDYKPPFSWLHSIETSNLAFVVVDGFDFTKAYDLKPPFGDKDAELNENDEYAVLIVVTVRPDPRMTTANLKAPLFVNLRNRKGVQVIFDNPNLSTRYSLWGEADEEQAEQKPEKK